MTGRRLRLIVLVLAMLVVPFGFSVSASAHRSGCHRWHSCPSDSGSYVCGDLGYTSGCGTQTYTPPATTYTPTVQAYTPPATHVPTITTNNVDADEVIPYTKTIRYTNREYQGYTNIDTTGVAGVMKRTTEITYSDGVETSRKVVANTVVREPVTEVITKGSRLVPTAKLLSVQKESKVNKYDINGVAKANVQVVLSLDGKRIKRTNTDKSGHYSFKGIKITRKTAKIIIYSRINGKEAIISEPYTVNLSKNLLVSDYQALHAASQ